MLRNAAITVLATIAMLALSITTAFAGTRTSGYYDHQVIEYESSTVTANSVLSKLTRLAISPTPQLSTMPPQSNQCHP